MRNCANLNGAWDFSFAASPCEGNIPGGVKYEGTISVPGCFDVMTPWFGKRGTGFFRRFVQTGGLVQLSIDGLGIEGEVFWDGKSVGSCPYAYMPEKFTFEPWVR